MDPLKSEILSGLTNEALVEGPEFVLASGQKSNLYVDCKKLSLSARHLKNLGAVFAKEIAEQCPEATHIAGVSIGGDPLVAAILTEGLAIGKEWKGLLLRKKPKDHGMSKGRYVEGDLGSDVTSVCLVEDVVSSGKSSIWAAEILASESYKLDSFACILDRQMGGMSKIRQKVNKAAFSLFVLSELEDAKT